MHQSFGEEELPQLSEEYDGLAINITVTNDKLDHVIPYQNTKTKCKYLGVTSSCDINQNHQFNVISGNKINSGVLRGETDRIPPSNLLWPKQPSPNKKS